MSVRETWTNSLTVLIAVLYSVVGFVETPERLSLFVIAERVAGSHLLVVYSTSTVVPVVDICTLFDFESTLTWNGFKVRSVSVEE